MAHNPFANMDKYLKQTLDKMNIRQLIAAQRDCLFEHEQEVFDKKDPIFLKPNDSREFFFDYTDRLIGFKIKEVMKVSGLSEEELMSLL